MGLQIVERLVECDVPEALSIPLYGIPYIGRFYTVIKGRQNYFLFPYMGLGEEI